MRAMSVKRWTLLAAVLEGGFRQLIQSTPGRFAVGIATGVLWFAYFTYVGRKARP